MRVLITGFTGRIGKALLFHKPPDIDAEVVIAPFDQTKSEYPWYRVDVTDHDRVIMAVTCSDPDVVIHLAAATDVDGCERDSDMAFRVNRDGTHYVAEACARCNAKLVYVSTDYVFDGNLGPYSEEDKPKPINVYGRSKFEGEQAASSLVENCAIVRISVPFGNRKEGVEHNYISWLVEELSAGNTVRIVKDQRTTPAYLEELGEVLWILARQDIRGLVHYGTSDRLSRYEMALEVCGSMGFPRELVQEVSTDELDFLAKRPLESGFITDKIHDIIGRPPILFSNALYRMIENSEMLV